MLIDRKLNEKIKIGDTITVTVVAIRPDCVKIGVEAPAYISVCRAENGESVNHRDDSK